VRGRRVAARGAGCDLACGRARLAVGESAEPVLGGSIAVECCSVLCGAALAGPEARGGLGLWWPEWLAGPALGVLLVLLGGHRLYLPRSAPGTLRPSDEGATPISPDRHAAPGSGSSRGGGSSARTGWPYSVQASLRHSQSWSGPPRASLAGWPQVGQRGGSLMPAFVPFWREGGALAPGSRRIHRARLVLWRPDIGRVSPPPWGRERGNHLGGRCRGRRAPRGESPPGCGVARAARARQLTS
jgi:hypothetical protein